MDKKTNILLEKEAVLLSHSVNSIYLYKIMLAAGFNRIAKSIGNNNIKNLIKELSTNEKSDAEYFAQTLNNNKINLLEFICERSSCNQYYSSITDSFLPLSEFTSAI